MKSTLYWILNCIPIWLPVLIVLGAPADAQVPDQVVEFDPVFSWGWCGLMAGEQAVLGLPRDSANQFKGNVYIFERNALGHWDQTQRIDGQSLQENGFGQTLAESQGRLAVGARSSVRIYLRQASGQWALVQELSGFQGPSFSPSLAVSDDGEWLAVGHDEASAGGVSEVGTVFLYRWNAGLGQFELFGNLDTPNPQSATFSGFGTAVAFVSGRCLVHSNLEDTLFDYYFDGTAWMLADQIVAPGLPSTLFTPTLSARNGEFVFGRDDWPNTPNQPTFLFRLNGQGSTATWSLVQTIHGPNSSVGSVYPRWVDDDTLVVTQGRHYLFERTSQGSAFESVGTIQGWATFGGLLSYARDEFIWLASPFPAHSLPDMVIVQPNLNWLGVPVVYPNAVGASGRSPTLGALGSIRASDNDLAFHVGWATPGQFGYLMASQTQSISTPALSIGSLCVGGAIGRFVSQIQQTDSAGTMGFQVDLQNIPAPTHGVIHSHETWTFQVWMRDPIFNSIFTNGVEIRFL